MIGRSGSVRVSYSAMLILLAAVVSLSCSCSADDPNMIEHLQFTVVDSLLEPVFPVPGAAMQFCPPAGFSPLPDTLLAQFRAQLYAQTPPDTRRTDIFQVFLHATHRAAVLVSLAEDLSISADPSGFVADYQQSLIETYGPNQVVSGDYLVNDVQVKNYLVSDSAHVRFQLLCLAASPPAMEVQYVVPKESYRRLLRSLESSIGTIELVKQGR